MADTILYEVDGRIATVTLNRPERLNAITPTLQRELLEALRQAEADDNVHVAVVAGAGRSFCVGMDLRGENAPRGGATGDRNFLEDLARGWLAIWDLRLPVIAKVHGHCIAAGTQLAAICDVTFIAEDCRVGTPNLPLGAGFVGVYWAWLVGPKKAKEMFFPVGASISGREATEMGLFNRAVPATELDATVAAYAAEVAKVPKDILVLQKRAINATQEVQGFREALLRGVEIDALAHVAPSVRQMNRTIAERGLNATIEDWRAGRL
jgi:enoyl-CoA hydratase